MVVVREAILRARVLSSGLICLRDGVARRVRALLLLLWRRMPLAWMLLVYNTRRSRMMKLRRWMTLLRVSRMRISFVFHMAIELLMSRHLRD
jgi:hypothetical protein